MEKDEWNGNIMGYKGEGEWGLRELVRGEEVFDGPVNGNFLKLYFI